jgi:hypothetical protein
LLSLVSLAARLAREWEHRSWVWDSVQMEFLFVPNFGANQETAMLGALVLLLIVVFGGSILKAALRLAHRAKSKSDHSISRSPRRCNACADTDGSELEVEVYGVLQGWRLQAAEWNSLKRSVAYLLEIQRELLSVSA